MKTVAIIALAFLACLALISAPVFADDPPKQAGKQDSPVSLILQQFIEQREAGQGQAASQPSGDAVTRGQSDSGTTTKDAPGADSSPPSSDATEDPVRFDSSGNVQVYIHLENTEDATLQQLRNLGAAIEITNSDWNVVQAWVPITALDDIAALGAVQEITPPDYAVTKAGSVTTKGDAIHRADLVRTFSGISGSGVKVGVISDGVYAWRTSQSSNDLPDSIEVNPNSPGSGDEGTALLEIVHDLAPNAKLAFSGAGSSLDMVDSILWLANDAFDGEGADIIVDDYTFYREPYFQDGLVAKAAADVVAGGTVFASAAGNEADRHYAGVFVDGEDAYHDFDPSGATDIALRVSLGTWLVLQWNDQFGSSGNDYDLFICPPGLKPIKFNLQNDICEGSTRQQDGDDDPIESIFAPFFSNDSTADVYIRNFDASENKRLKLFTFRGEVLEHGVFEGAIFGHPAVPEILTVGAIDAADPGNNEPEFWSDHGPVEIYFPSRETRNKPDVMGIDGVLITGSGGFGRPIEGSTFRRFYGTSAAVPHVAGIAALVMEAQRKATPDATKKTVADSVFQTIRNTAIDLGEQDANGYSKVFGYGRADAFAALESIASSSDAVDLYSKTSYTDTHTVNSTGDGADDDTTDGVCDDGTVDGSTNCTLRAAIQQTNAGTGAAIKFNISGSGVQSIGPASALPAITKPVFIDGHSQPGASTDTVLIELDGTNAGTDVDGLTLQGTGSYVRGLAVKSFSRYGIRLRNSDKHVLAHNMIGTDTTGSTDEGNGSSGVYLDTTLDVNLRNNVISGNDHNGVETNGGGRILLYANNIGTNAAGTADLGNSLAGVSVSSPSITLRNNVISGNDVNGLLIKNNVSKNVTVENNRIGTNAAGDVAVDNTGSGILISNQPKNSLVTGNIIGGNSSHGISLTGSGIQDNLIAENYIGANAGGTDLGNGGSGVHISGGPNGNTVERNTIANNGGDGVTIVGNDSLGNTVWENSIHSNDGHGIDLGDDGVTANDAGDGDAGPNHLQNYPANITFASRDDDASIRFTLDVTANRKYIVDFYSCDSSTSGEGQEWLGFVSSTPPSSGTATVTGSTLLGQLDDFSGTTATHVTATATDDETGSTSEFAPCVARVALPELVISDAQVEVREGSTATYTVALSALPSANVTVTLSSGDADVATVSDTTLTFTTANGTNAQNVTVTGTTDTDANYEATEILHEVSIGSYRYPTAVIPVEVSDDDVPVLTLASTHTAADFPSDVSDGYPFDGRIGGGGNGFNEGSTANYTVQLDSEPKSDTTINLSRSNRSAVAVSPTSITFTKTGEASDANKHEWDDPQTVTLTAVTDSDASDEIVLVSHKITVDSKNYVLGQVEVIVWDSALPAFTYSTDNREVTISSEDGTATYTIVPATEPSSNLTVYLTSSATSSVTVSPSSMTFTVGVDGNWEMPQEITVTGVADDDDFDDFATINHWSIVDGQNVYLPSVRVAVTDGNRAPFFEDGLKTSREVHENAAQGANVGAPVTATDLNNDTLTYSLDDPSGKFIINSASGQITLVASNSLDHEMEQDYTMNVNVTDRATNGLTDNIEVKVLVTNVNEPPEITRTTGDDTLSYPETTSTTRVLHRYTATDPERDSIAWTVEGPNGSDFAIDPNGNLRFASQPDHETKPTYDITIVATDDGSPVERGELTVTVTVTNVNEAPEIHIGSDSITYDENASPPVDQYFARDPEGATTTFTWSLSGTDRGDFTITGGQLQFASTPDFERPADSGGNNVYNVRVRVSDGSLTGTKDVTVTVQDLNEPPTITGDAALSYPENTATTRVLDRYTATDPERRQVTWSLSGTDADDFRIDASSGNLFFDGTPDYEAAADSGGNNVYDIQVVATDDGNLNDGTVSQRGALSASFDVTITVTDVNEPPTVTGDADAAVDENTETFTRTYFASDPDGAASTFTWSLSGADRGDFNMDGNGNTGELTFRNTPDHERPADSNRDNEYLVTVWAADERGLRGSLAVTVTVNNVDERPTITGDATPPPFPENSVRSVATYRAADPERSPITWSLSGDDRDDFNISQTGVLTFANIPDFENPADADEDNEYVLTVEARDDGFHFDRLDVTVAVTNSTGKEEPTITTTRDPSPYRENGTGAVHTFRARDPQGRPVNWRVTGTDDHVFEISPSGVLSFVSPPDFENPTDSNGDNVYEITVVVTDEQALTDSFDVTIIVTNYHENLEPAITTGPSSGLTYHQLNYQENRTSTVYTYSARNYGSGSLSWSLSGTDAGAFTITGDSRSRGVLTFDGTPDFESPDDLDDDNDYEITVVVTNAGGYTDRLDVVVTVTDVNEGPEVRGRDSFNVEENQDLPSATYRATDPEGDTITRWNLGGRDGSDFNISQDETLTFRSLPDYERPADSNRDNVYEVEIRPYDGRNYGSFDVTVIVEDVNEAPTITTTSTSAKTLRQPENRTSRLYTYRATDPEGATIMWSVGGTDRGFFTINERGEFSFKETSPPDYEIPGDSGGDNIYDVMVQATDDDSNTARFEVTVTVSEVNEGPEVTSGGDSFTVRENLDWQGASFTAADPEGSAITRWRLGGRDGGDFNISETGLMTFRTTPDHERPADSNRDNVYEVEVRPYDGRYYGSHEVMVMVEDVDEITGPATLNRSENFEGVLANYSATGRGDLTVAPTWRLSGTDRGDFTITEDGELTFRSIPDHERPADSDRDNVYSFAVQASDDRYYGTLDVTVTVTPVNEPPTITTTGRTTFTRQENDSAVFYTFRAIDPEGSAVTWSTGGQDGGDFAIDGGALKFGSPPDFENPQGANGNEYHVTVQATDDGSNTASLPVTVTVTDLNEGPEVMGPAQFTIAENQGLSNAVYAARDPEGSYVALWSVAGRDGGDFFITQGGTLAFRYPPDYERPADSNRDNRYEVSVQPSDGRNTGSYAVTVTVTDVNEPPDLRRGSTTSFTQPENRTSRLYRYSATDPERGNSKLVSGRDGRESLHHR